MNNNKIGQPILRLLVFLPLLNLMSPQIAWPQDTDEAETLLRAARSWGMLPRLEFDLVFRDSMSGDQFSSKLFMGGQELTVSPLATIQSIRVDVSTTRPMIWRTLEGKQTHIQLGESYNEIANTALTYADVSLNFLYWPL